MKRKSLYILNSFHATNLNHKKRSSKQITWKSDARKNFYLTFHTFDHFSTFVRVFTPV